MKHAASVRPEPGSNSPLYVIKIFVVLAGIDVKTRRIPNFQITCCEQPEILPLYYWLCNIYWDIKIKLIYFCKTKVGFGKSRNLLGEVSDILSLT